MRKITLICILFVLPYLAADAHVKPSKAHTNNSRMINLHVKREKNRLIAIFADVIIYVNENEIGRLANGEEKDFTFPATKSGYVSIRFESSTIALSETIEAAATKSDKFTQLMRKEIRVKTRKISSINFFCTFNERELFVRRVEI